MVVDFILTILECIVSVIAMILIFVAFVYYFSNFVEERMRKVQALMKNLTLVVLGISLLIPLSGFPWYIFVIIFATNSLWLWVQYSGFPFISLGDPKLAISFICTILSHFLLMLYYLSQDASFFQIVSYFFLFVWFIPILVLSSLCALDEDQVEQTNSKTNDQDIQPQPRRTQSKGVFNKIIGRLLKKAENNLPMTGRKDD